MNTKKISAILCADLHLREDQPLCRTDNYFLTQINKLNFLFELGTKHNIWTFFCAGDFFDKAKVSEEFKTNLLECDMPPFYVIPGNHDLPEHNVKNFKKSSLGVMKAADKVTVKENVPLETFHTANIKNRKIGLIHKLIHKSTEDSVVAEGKTISYPAQKLLKDNPEFDLILSGDNHKTFVEEYEGRLLVNPGSMMRMTAAQVDHKPCVFLYYAETNTIEPVYFPIEQGVVSREHIEEKQHKEERDKRMDAFVKKAGINIELGIKFEKNLEEYFKLIKIRKAVQQKVWEFVG